MAFSVSLAGTFHDTSPGAKDAKDAELDFMSSLVELCERFGGHVTSGTLTGDHVAGTINAQGRVSWTTGLH